MGTVFCTEYVDLETGFAWAGPDIEIPIPESPEAWAAAEATVQQLIASGKVMPSLKVIGVLMFVLPIA